MNFENIIQAAGSFREMLAAQFAIVNELADSEQERLQALQAKVETATQATRFNADELVLIEAGLTITGGLVEACIAGKQLLGAIAEGRQAIGEIIGTVFKEGQNS